MKKKILLLIAVSFLFIACKSDKDKDSTPIDTEETTTQKEEEITASSEIAVAEQILEASKAFKNIESKLATMEKKRVSGENDGNQSLEIEGYYDGNTLLKLVRLEAGGHGSVQTDYYFTNDKLFFVFEQSKEEASVKGPYTDREKRVYVSNGAIIRILKKEKTVKKISESNLAKVQNVDITAAVEGKGALLQEYNAQVSAAKEQLKKAPITLLDGKYRSEDDANASITIKNGKYTESYKSGTTNSSEVFDFQVSKKQGSSEENLKLTSTRNNEVYNYTILEHNSELLKLLYLPRGNILTYRKEKINLTIFSTFPAEIDGCACYFASSKSEFKKGNYIYVDNFENTGFLYLNGEKTIFTLGKAKETSEGFLVQTGTNHDYELRLETIQVGQVDETWQRKGKLILKSKGKVLIEKELYGECGC